MTDISERLANLDQAADEAARSRANVQMHLIDISNTLCEIKDLLTAIHNRQR